MPCTCHTYYVTFGAVCVCDPYRGAILPSLHRMLRQINRLVPVCRSLASLEASASSSFSRAFADDANLQKTVLYDLHVANGGASIAPRPPRAGDRAHGP